MFQFFYISDISSYTNKSLSKKLMLENFREKNWTTDKPQMDPDNVWFWNWYIDLELTYWFDFDHNPRYRANVYVTCQTRRTVFDHISKHREESWKYDVQQS